MRMGGTFTIARFPSNSLSTPEFRWLHEDAWEDTHKSYFFSVSAKKLPLGILGPTPLVRRRQSSAPALAARYVLDLPLGQPAAGLEIQVCFASFTSLHIMVSGLYPNDATDAGDWSMDGRAALAFIVSAAIILSKADVLRLVPGDSMVAEQFQRLGWGNPRSIWTPWTEDAWLSSLQRGLPLGRGVKMPIVEISPSDWWQCDDGLEAHKALSYLEKQMVMREQATPKTSKPKGLINILGSLFGRR